MGTEMGSESLLAQQWQLWVLGQLASALAAQHFAICIRVAGQSGR